MSDDCKYNVKKTLESFKSCIDSNFTVDTVKFIIAYKELVKYFLFFIYNRIYLLFNAIQF